jgi:hypothetical protein
MLTDVDQLWAADTSPARRNYRSRSNPSPSAIKPSISLPRCREKPAPRKAADPPLPSAAQPELALSSVLSPVGVPEPPLVPVPVLPLEHSPAFCSRVHASVFRPRLASSSRYVKPSTYRRKSPIPDVHQQTRYPIVSKP